MSLVINLKADTGLVLRNENTTRFYKDIRKFNVMTREEETQWFNMLSDAKSRMEKAKEEKDLETFNSMNQLADEIRELIINSNQRLCVAAAKNWSNTDNLMDYVNEANFGLMEAIEKFDASKGFKFASYAMWFIKRAIEKYHHSTMPMVQRTNNSKTWSIVPKITNDFMQQNERQPSTEELKDMVNAKLKPGKGIKDSSDLSDIHVTMIDDGSSDVDAYGHNESMSTGDIMDYNRMSATANKFESVENDEFNKKLVSSLLNVLNPRERKLLQMRFGLIEVDGIQREFTLGEIAEELNLTTERVRQMEQAIFKRLKTEYADRITNIY